MPDVKVYVPAARARALEGAGHEVPLWVRARVAAALSRFSPEHRMVLVRVPNEQWDALEAAGKNPAQIVAAGVPVALVEAGAPPMP